MTNHFFQKVRDASHRRANSEFLETLDGGSLTYAGMEAMTARYASALIKLGVKPGDRVAAQVEKSPEALMLYLGTLRAGAVFLPLNSAYTSAELEYFLADAEPKILVCDQHAPRQLGAGRGTGLCAIAGNACR